MAGAFQISRDIFSNPIWSDVPKFRIFFFIVGNAVFAEDGVNIAHIHIKRGQFLRSYRNLSDDLQYIENRTVKKYSVSVISRKIDSLVKEERLKIEDTELGTLFTVVNYDEYQRLENYKRKLGTELEQSWNSDGTVLEQSRNNNKKVNNVKNVNIKDSRSKLKFETQHMQLAELLFKKMVSNNPNVKKPNFEQWADAFRKTMELDKRKGKDVQDLIIWSQQDSFWHKNILSADSLRRQFDRLYLEMNSKKPNQQEPTGRYVPDTAEIDMSAGEDW